MIRTCIKKRLVYQGPYHLRLLEKGMPMPAPGYEDIPIFFVETDDRKYKGMIEVTMTEYKKGKVGQFYGMGGVLFYTKKRDCYYMSKYDNEKIAIKKAIQWARFRLVFLAIVCSIVIWTFLPFFIPSFR